jgi:ribonucleoside-triphosphate reductase (formate)
MKSMTIIKRSGKIEKLTSKKIFDSICKANGAVQDQDSRLTQK